MTINPNLNTSLKNVLAQGHNVGDIDTDSSGASWRWNGNVWESQGGGSGAGGGSQASPAFNFDWNAARQTAFDQLTPYYAQKLDLAKGDVELAKKYIEADYQNGLRKATDTYTTDKAYNTASGQNQTAQEQLSADNTLRENRGQLNNKGVLLGENTPGNQGQPLPDSQYAKTFVLDPAQQATQLRQQAIQRAVQRQSDILDINKQSDIGNSTPTAADDTSTIGATRDKSLQAQDVGLKNTAADLGQAQTSQAVTNANQQYAQDYSSYQAANKNP